MLSEEGVLLAFRIILALTTTLLFLPFLAIASSVPRSINYQGFLTDSAGTPINGIKQMRFAIYTGSVATPIWYAEYREVKTIDGFFSVHLGDPAQGGIALHPSNGWPNGLLPIFPELLSGIDSDTAVELEIQISNGKEWEALKPRVKYSSTLFALKADMVGDILPEKIVKFDSKKNVLSSSGLPVISPTGAWIGPTTGMGQGTVGPTGPAGAIGATGPTGPQGPSLTNGIKVVSNSGNGVNLIADCGNGYIAISGGGDCSKGKAISASCSCSSNDSSTCDTAGPSRYWLLKCLQQGNGHAVTATCVRE